MDFNSSYDLYDDIYLNYTELIFEVIAMDNGTIPRGMSANISITVSNTCVMDVLYESIKYMFVVDNTTGEMNLVIPKYWVFLFGEFQFYRVGSFCG